MAFDLKKLKAFMNYQIKIENAQEANGEIDLGRLATIAEGIRKISEGALQIRLKGISASKGPKKVSLKEALKVTLTGLKGGSTVLDLSTEKFEQTLSYQADIFRQEAQQDLPQQTPVSLFIHAFNDALNAQDDHGLLDKPLLNELKNFRKAFLKDDEILTISNQGSLPDLKLEKRDFKKIKDFEEELPDPEPVMLNGIVDELKYSKLKVRIQTEEGIVDGFLSNSLATEDIAPYWGQKVTITGTSHFKPGGKSVIEIQRIFESGEGDEYFSKKPESETVQEQFDRQLREKGAKNQLSAIAGKWPGNESDEEFDRMLNDLD